MNRNVKLFAALFFFVIILNAQGIKIRDLPALTSTPASGDILPIATLSPTVTKKVDLHTLASYFASDSLLVPSTRTITCTAPLLCAGGVSMDLSADRTFSISPAVLTSTTNGGPVTWSTTGSTITGATNEGLRNAMVSLFNTNTSDVNNAVLMIDSIQTTNAGAACVTRTGLDVKTYTMPDNGCDTSSALIVQSGGGSGISVYKLHTLRPTGFTDYSSSIQGAIEAGTNDQSQAGLFMSGINIGGVATNSSTAILARVDNANSRGIVIQPNDNTFDTRDALIVGTAQINAAPINQKFGLKMNGNITTAGSVVATGAITGSNISGTNTGDQIVPVNTTATASNWFSAYNSSTGAYTKSRPAMTDLSDATTWEGWTDNGSTINTTANTDKVGIGTSSPDALLTVSANAATLPAALAGTVGRFAQADGTSTRVGISAFGAGVPTIDFIHAAGTAASPTATQSGTTIMQHTAFGFGTAVATGAKITAETEEIFTGSTNATSINVYTTKTGTTSPVKSLTVSGNGHLSCGGTTAPTVTCTGTGTSPTAPSIDSGGTDCKFTILMNTGTGSPGNTGTCTVTFGSAYVSNKPVMVCMLVDGASAWSNEAVVRLSTQSLTAPVITWTNEASGALTGLTVSTSYKISCLAFQ